MADKWVEAEQDYLAGMKYKDIAAKYDVALSTVKSWKQRYGWSRNKDAPPKKSTRTKSKSTRTKNIVEEAIQAQDDFGLNDRQIAFAEAYIETGNASKSAEAAGYKSPGQMGYRLLKNVQIKRYINDRMYQVRSLSIMTADEALKELSAIALGLVDETVVVATPVGAETVTKPIDPRTRMTAIKELLKRYPGNDALLDAQVRRTQAEATISEAKAAAIQTTGAEQERQDEQIDRLLAGINIIAQEELRKADEENG